MKVRVFLGLCGAGRVPRRPEIMIFLLWAFLFAIHTLRRHPTETLSGISADAVVLGCVVRKLGFDSCEEPSGNNLRKTCTLSGVMFPCGRLFDAKFYVAQLLPPLNVLDAEGAFDHWLRSGFRAGLRSHPGRRIMKVVLMTKDEWPLIKSWVLYHCALFGAENIYVLDSSGPGPALEFLISSSQNLGFFHISAPTEGLSYAENAINLLMTSLMYSCDFLMKVDTDEFVTLLSPKQDALYDVESIRSYFDHLPVNGTIYRLPWFFENFPTSGCTMDNDPAQDSIVFDGPRLYAKAFVAAPSFLRMDLGAHVGYTRPPYDLVPGPFMSDLAIMHLRNSCFEKVMANNLRAVVGHGYVNASDSREEQLKKLRPLATQNGIHSVHKVTGLLSFLEDPEKTRRDFLLTHQPTAASRRDDGLRNRVQELIKHHDAKLSIGQQAKDT